MEQEEERREKESKTQKSKLNRGLLRGAERCGSFPSVFAGFRRKCDNL